MPILDVGLFEVDLEVSFQDHIDASTIAALIARWETQEVRDGVNAFFDGRPTPWIAAPDSS